MQAHSRKKNTHCKEDVNYLERRKELKNTNDRDVKTVEIQSLVWYGVTNKNTKEIRTQTTARPTVSSRRHGLGHTVEVGPWHAATSDVANGSRVRRGSYSAHCSELATDDDPSITH